MIDVITWRGDNNLRVYGRYERVGDSYLLRFWRTSTGSIR